MKSSRVKPWIYRLALVVPLLVVMFAATEALARVGGGESYNSGKSSSSNGDGDGGAIVYLLVRLIIEYPAIGIPLAIIVAVIWFAYQRNQGSASTRKALDRAEAQTRTTVSAGAVDGWVAKLKAKDPEFALLPFLDRTKKLFAEVQEGWFRRNLEGVRRHLSDATFQRLVVQLKMMELQGVRDAIADVQVIDLALIGLEQTASFDSVHVRVQAQLRDTDVPVATTDEAARAAAMKCAPERFIEVWTFVRKPGVSTKIGDESHQGGCPNCGAPFNGGAANTCEHCGAIVNSGHYDWVLSQITQGVEFKSAARAVAGVDALKARDPKFTLEALEDRGALVFWKWLEAQLVGDASKLAKVAQPPVMERIKGEVDHLTQQGKRKLFLEAAVGSVHAQAIEPEGDVERAVLEIRWSARMGVALIQGKPPQLPSAHQRWAFILERKATAATSEKTGMASNHCPTCMAPLTDNGQPACEFCGTMLASGDQDWVLHDAWVWESYLANRRSQGRPLPKPSAGSPQRVPDRDERERLIYVMAVMAMADGVVDDSERKLLKTMSERYRVPWANVELALKAGPGLFDKLMAKGSPEAEAFLRELVAMALVDGKVDHSEKKMLESAAQHLGLKDKLGALLKGQ